MFDISALKFDSSGLIPAIVQDHENGQVLMMAFMNRLSIEKTLQTGLCHYWSRSRGKLWLKGETSGHTQAVKEAYYDCDADCLLFRVEQKTAACHTGHRSCFFTRIDSAGATSDAGEKVFEAADVYSGSDVLDKVFTVIKDRMAHPVEGSYVCATLGAGKDSVLKKVGEEASELMLAAKGGDKGRVVHEAADLLFHVMLALADSGVEASEVYAELKGRRKK